MNTSTPVLIIAGLLAALTWAVSRTVLKENDMLNNPLISPCVGGLAFIGLISMGDQWINAILLPYAALAIVLLLLLAFGWVAGQRQERRPDRDDETDKPGRSPKPPTSKRSAKQNGGEPCPR